MTTVTVTAKPWYTSKLVWLGILQAVLGALEILKNILETVPVEAHTLVGPVHVSPATGGVASLVFGVLTLFWRWKTNRPIAASEKPVDVPRVP